MHLFVIVAALGALALHSGAAAAAQRTFVASSGIDVNPCSLVLPCRGFAAAMLQTDPKGEIVVLDSAGYGSVTVDKSVSIIAPPGVYAGISVFSGSDGIDVNAGPSDKAVLRGLTINGQGGFSGIVVNQAAWVEIDRCTISNMGLFGILVAGASKVTVEQSRLSGSFGSGMLIERGDVTVIGSQFENNGSSGIDVHPGAASNVQLVVRDSSLGGNSGNGIGAFAGGAGIAVNVTVEGTAAVRNVGAGFYASTLGGGVTTFVLSNSVASRNGGVGFDAIGSNVTASASRSTLARNYTFDMRQSLGAVLRSHGNNALSGDGPGNVSGTVTQIGLF
jgi:hypothetical protein